MKRPGSRRRRIWLGLMASPFLAWALILLIVPTGWAKARMVARLAQATGRSVRIGSLRLGMLGHLRVLDVAIAERTTPDDPWIAVPEAQIDVHLGQVLLGRCAPGEIRLVGPSVRLLRRLDGTWECGELARPDAGGGSAAAPAHEAHGGTTSLVVEGGSLRVEDRANGVGFEVANVSARGARGPTLATIDELRGDLNGGSVQLAARLERGAGPARFEAEVRAHGVALDPGLDGLAYLVPMVSGTSGGVRGTLDFHVAATGQGTTFAEARRSLRGHGSVAIDPVDLVGSRFLSELDVMGDLPDEDRVGSISCDYAIEKGRAVSDNLTLRVGRFPLVLAGWTDFDGRFDYGVRSDRMSELLPRDARGLLNELHVNFDQLAGLHVLGNPSRVEATLHGRPIRGDDGDGKGRNKGKGNGHDDDRARLRDTARRLRDRLFR